MSEIKLIKKWIKNHLLEIHREKVNSLVLLGILISLFGTLLASSDTVNVLRHLPEWFVPEVCRIDKGVQKLTFFPQNGKHAALNQYGTGFNEIMEIIRKYDQGVPKDIVQITNRKEYPVTFYWAQKGDQHAILLDLVENADEQSEVYPVNYTSEVFRWINQERSRILVSRGFCWVFWGMLIDLVGCFFSIRFKYCKGAHSETIKVGLPSPHLEEGASSVGSQTLGIGKDDAIQTWSNLYSEAKDAFIDTWRHKQSLFGLLQVYFSVYALFLGLGILKFDYIFELVQTRSISLYALSIVLVIAYFFSLYCVVRGLWLSANALRMSRYRTFPKITELIKKLSEKEPRVYYKSLVNDFAKSQEVNTRFNEERAEQLVLVHEYIKGMIISGGFLICTIFIFKYLGG